MQTVNCCLPAPPPPNFDRCQLSVAPGGRCQLMTAPACIMPGNARLKLVPSLPEPSGQQRANAHAVENGASLSGTGRQ